MTRASTGMLEKGTQTPSPAPDLIPARNRPRDGSLKAEIVSMEGCNENNSKCANRRLSQPRGSPHESVPFCAYEKADKSWEMQLWNGRTNRSRGSAVPFCSHEKPPLFIQVVEKVWRPRRDLNPCY